MTLQVQAQIQNDECFESIRISDPVGFCGEFTTVGSSASEEPNPSCWPQFTVSQDVWFSFIALRTSGVVRLFGQSDMLPDGLDQPSIAVYRGPCLNLIEVQCNSILTGLNGVEIFIDNLILGELYFIRIDGRDDNVGTFELCTDLFNAVPVPEQDCGRAVLLCDNSPFSVEVLQGAGQFQDEADDSCLDTDPNTGADDGDSEDSSAWYVWTVDESGSLVFTLTPNNMSNDEEDLDFALYFLPNGVEDCNGKQLIRCMASGETIGQSASANAPCFGPTGLNFLADDLEESRGCEAGDDNFLSAVEMISGQSYGLLVNNFTNSGIGFSIEFGGTATFLGPEPEFEFDIQAEAFALCDKSITFIDSSFLENDDIIRYEWNFGVGAKPQFATGIGPHEILYDSFGDKIAALTVESQGGCLVTHAEEIRIEPCCQDTSTLGIDFLAANLICAGDPTGSIEIKGVNGGGVYTYSFNGSEFRNNPIFEGLDIGIYNIAVMDQKGCEISSTVTLSEPEPLTVNAGPDQLIELGDGTQLMGQFGPIGADVRIEWSPPDGLSCTNCLQPDVIPPGTTEYTLTISTPDGCETTDQVRIIVEADRSVFAPNTISANEDGNNDYFKVFTGKAGASIQTLYVYDRWGSKVYEGQELPVGDELFVGWDGTFRGEPVNPGVFAWQADIRYVDNVVIQYEGTVTLIR